MILYSFHRQAIFLLCLLLLTGCSNQQSASKPPQLQDDTTATNISEELLSEITDSIRSGYYPNIHSLLICQGGERVYEQYFEGTDMIWGNELGLVMFDASTLHDVRSISKSVVSACIGIAIDQGQIESVHQRIFDFFEDYTHLGNEFKNKLTIYHLLTMTAGLDWDESVPNNNTELLMEQSTDKIAFVLGRKAIHPPGTKWNYSGGNTELLAQIILRTTGHDIYQYAKQHIFDKIGIEKSYWTNYTNTDMPAAASGLRLTSRGLLNFGLLYLNDGKWGEEQVISSSWIEESLNTSVLRGEPDEHRRGYGYQFWTWEHPFRGDYIHISGARGNGGQQIYLDKTNEIVIVITAGNYDKWTLPVDSYSIFEKIYESF